MCDCNNGCVNACVQCSGAVPVVRDGVDVTLTEDEMLEGGTRTAGAPIYTLVVTNPALPE